ncbi:hypothetical protein CAPTEDRAFT_179604 [Capitella teleta]|uniref:Non-canonical purine NTP phosphatase/PRRC1 domain-containing protein n=1 Tax=Capitella teleta TaxID=283909 RepID=R7VMD4_CAPTE|nr:hypothetical protein CAPTEDRAFT_179604 [Capitella teleta]|eukprot:ELU18645.1 hypothetical protein CAPTEDRAFT_179604 [Capitella teleta]
MKEVIYSGGDIDIIVTSTKDAKVTAIRDAFQEVFGKATVTGMESQPNIAPQPVGYSAGLKGAEERIENLRRSNAVHEHQVVVSIENFIVEMLPDCWFDVACVLLKDPLHNIEIQVFSQSTPVHLDYVQMAQDATPTDYNLSWSGLSVTVGEMIERSDPRICRSDWHQHLSGVSRRQIITLAGKALASLYQRQRHAPQI